MDRNQAKEFYPIQLIGRELSWSDEPVELKEEQLMYRPITMYQIVCDRCGKVFGGTDTCSALFSNKEVDIGDYSDWEMIIVPIVMKQRSLMECITLKQRRNRYGSIKRHKSVNKRLRSDIY